MTGFAKEEIQKIKVTSTGIQFFQSDFRKKLPKSIAIVKYTIYECRQNLK